MEEKTVYVRCVNDRKVYRALAHVTMFGKGNPKHQILAVGILAGLSCLATVLALFFISYEIFRGLLWLTVLLLALLALYLFLPWLSYQSAEKAAGVTAELWFGAFSFQILGTMPDGTVQGTSEISYVSLEKVVETNDYLFLFQSRSMAYVVPKNAIQGGTVDELRARVLVGGVKHVRCRY